MTPQLESKLKQIRLSGMVQALPARLAQAHGGNLTHLEFLDLLVADELAVRSDRLFWRRLKQAGLEEVKEFADFDWSFNPKLPRNRLCDLATARFVRERTNILLVGPPGVGKSHSVSAIAIGAIRAGYRVVVKSVFELTQELLEAEATRLRGELVERLSTIDVLILEDFGMKTLRSTAAEDLLDIFMRRHERLPTIITTNRPTQDWGHFLGDVPAATAILDRFLQHVEIILMQGRSYRLGRRPQSPTVTPPDPQDDESQTSTAKNEPLRSPENSPTAAALPPGPPPAPSRRTRARPRAR
jgi:DNA replication protein DnaC